jgi:hypothetical protein
VVRNWIQQKKYFYVMIVKEFMINRPNNKKDSVFELDRLDSELRILNWILYHLVVMKLKEYNDLQDIQDQNSKRAIF